MKRTVLIVLDSFGIGALPDAADYGDAGASTLGGILKGKPDLNLPNLCALGIGAIDGVTHLPVPERLTGAFGRLAEQSRGKDTITGHWEIAGLLTTEPFQTFERFPDAFIHRFTEAIGTGVLGNIAASGTEIIKQLGEEHARTGKPIVYTSADSVFQIAANTEIIPLERLYEICRIARAMLTGALLVGRVIARPFVVRNGEYIRTSDRKDYAVSPIRPTLLDHLAEAGQTVYAIGKIGDIFNGQGITRAVHTEDNQDGVDKTLEALDETFGGLIFTNLVDFDSKFGHRRNAPGYGEALERFDARLPEIQSRLKEEDVLILCADHGNDPSHSGWDHTREYIPVLYYGARVRPGVNLGTGESFADIAATIAAYQGVRPTEIGRNRLPEILKPAAAV